MSDCKGQIHCYWVKVSWSKCLLLGFCLCGAPVVVLWTETRPKQVGLQQCKFGCNFKHLQGCVALDCTAWYIYCEPPPSDMEALDDSGCLLQPHCCKSPPPPPPIAQVGSSSKLRLADGETLACPTLPTSPPSPAGDMPHHDMPHGRADKHAIQLVLYYI